MIEGCDLSSVSIQFNFDSSSVNKVLILVTKLWSNVNVKFKNYNLEINRIEDPTEKIMLW